jgi:small subunit ribosomal protein S16
LSYRGVLIKKHLLEGVKKGAFDEAVATKRFEEWMQQNEAKIEAKKSLLEKSQDDELGKRLVIEKNINEARAAKLAKRAADLVAREAAGDKADAIAVETVTEETVTDETVTDEAVTDETVTEESVVEETITEVGSSQVEEAVESDVNADVITNEETVTDEAAQTQVDDETAADPVTEDKPQE